VRAAAGTGLDPIANVLYYHRDYQGSVVGTSLRSGGVDGVTGAGYRYTPYGQLDRATNVTAASDSELGYTNGLRLLWKAGTAPALPQTPGLVLLGARVYHAELKRWLQPDTVDALRYTYTGGDPVNFIDPSGRAASDAQITEMHLAYRSMQSVGSSNAFESTSSWKLAPANNTPAPAPVAQGGADATPQVTTTENDVNTAPSPEPGNENAPTAGQSQLAGNLNLGNVAGQLNMKSMDADRDSPDFGTALLEAAQKLFAGKTYAKGWQCSDMPCKSANHIGFNMPDTLAALMADPRAHRIGFEEGMPGNLAIVVSNVSVAPKPEHGMLFLVNIAENLSSAKPTSKVFYSTLGSFEDPKKPGPASGLWFTHDYVKATNTWMPKSDDRAIFFYRWVP
jgi:RHS repeat-associated protein